MLLFFCLKNRLTGATQSQREVQDNWLGEAESFSLFLYLCFLGTPYKLIQPRETVHKFCLRILMCTLCFFQSLAVPCMLQLPWTVMQMEPQPSGNQVQEPWRIRYCSLDQMDMRFPVHQQICLVPFLDCTVEKITV